MVFSSSFARSLEYQTSIPAQEEKDNITARGWVTPKKRESLSSLYSLMPAPQAKIAYVPSTSGRKDSWANPLDTMKLTNTEVNKKPYVLDIMKLVNIDVDGTKQQIRREFEDMIDRSNAEYNKSQKGRHSSYPSQVHLSFSSPTHDRTSNNYTGDRLQKAHHVFEEEFSLIEQKDFTKDIPKGGKRSGDEGIVVEEGLKEEDVNKGGYLSAEDLTRNYQVNARLGSKRVLSKDSDSETELLARNGSRVTEDLDYQTSPTRKPCVDYSRGTKRRANDDTNCLEVPPPVQNTLTRPTSSRKVWRRLPQDAAQRPSALAKARRPGEMKQVKREPKASETEKNGKLDDQVPQWKENEYDGINKFIAELGGVNYDKAKVNSMPVAGRKDSWSEQEGEVLIFLVKAIKDWEKRENRSRIWKDKSLFRPVAFLLRENGIDRSHNAAKNEWNRRFRKRSGIDERGGHEMNRRLETSVQRSKKGDLKRKQTGLN